MPTSMLTADHCQVSFEIVVLGDAIFRSLTPLAKPIIYLWGSASLLRSKKTRESLGQPNVILRANSPGFYTTMELSTHPPVQPCSPQSDT